MFNRRFFILTFMFLFVGAIFVLPNTTELAEAHVSPNHTFPEWDQEFDIDFWFIDAAITLSCEGFAPNDGIHVIPWPHKACFPLGVFAFGPNNNGCYDITMCAVFGRCTGLFCPGDDDDIIIVDDTGGNNDDSSGNNG